MKITMMMKLFLSLVVAGTFVCSCAYRNEDEIELAIDCSSKIPDTVSYSNHVQPIFTKNCALSNCHSGGSPTGKLNLESQYSYTALMKKGSGYVDTINPSISVLMSALNSRSTPMPPTGNLDKCSIELIKTWMLQKAKNN